MITEGQAREQPARNAVPAAKSHNIPAPLPAAFDRQAEFARLPLLFFLPVRARPGKFAA
jgi:hypothetical protein